MGRGGRGREGMSGGKRKRGSEQQLSPRARNEGWSELREIRPLILFGAREQIRGESHPPQTASLERDDGLVTLCGVQRATSTIEKPSRGFCNSTPPQQRGDAVEALLTI
eukprot:scaffold62927_cov32-Tisochrysis_lutea.AAC.7